MSSDKFEFTIKHAGKLYPITLSNGSTVEELKNEVQGLTMVPMERQKYMVKGGLTDNTISNLSSVIKPGSTVMLLGTPDADMISKPKESNKFIEDLAPEHQRQKFNQMPIGLLNMGNTCYMNSTLQALYRVDGLRDMVLKYKEQANVQPGDELHYKLISELKRCFENLQKKSYESVMPVVFLNLLRKCYPQFAEVDNANGIFKQQDAEELFTQLFSSLNIVFGEKFTDDFEVQFRTTIKDSNNEDDVTIKENEIDSKLKCHISGTTNFMKNGLIESLHEEIEKRSEHTGVNSTYLVDKQITKLPKYLTVQYVRFFWKRSTNKKSKILRKVQFPFQLDVADMLTPEYAQEKIKIREELRKIEKEKSDDERELKRRKVNDSDSDGTTMTPREKQETEEALEDSRREHWLQEYKKHFPTDLRPGENPSCVYDLIGVITHQGANSESGHYQSFIRDEKDENKWYKFNDDKVSVVEREKIEALAGGGESDSALILIYKGLGL
ncbi:hypothetical protein Kpol_534p23 [Vanderwaltozyma polyspora DSM 70294]|uniref:Ubiquitin carboxyl-terminal hydrolase n=1 Tax=Vanderwaltozyma polyspora (strain ATCC 22028 / DSM 70294 / BCRC 21397 / CBS 2163 / NBRC 10782 / NRRL Y-8283 / UCD 57-17) TaxID=436907 RepID=A7TJK1_VANPO|nr:uncharacterized protein Kpol_534p23 [Vanderwaltozyma polyspora DSM 70294]EDO17544.1 hypothetical protein Kpol_534p23 [Vanderwaltozyma polyspora DSM 70294]